MDRLYLTSLHSARRLEFNAVLMVGVEDGAFPHNRADAKGVAEDRRLFYVGVTRAPHEVHLMYSRMPWPLLLDLRERGAVA